MEIDNMATIDRVIVDPGVAGIMGRTYEFVSRIGGEILVDRPAWQDIYGKT
jgi:hypothetical protein